MQEPSDRAMQLVLPSSSSSQNALDINARAGSEDDLRQLEVRFRVGSKSAANQENEAAQPLKAPEASFYQ